MDGTVMIIFRPADGTEDQVLLPIEEFAERAKTSRRQIDRLAVDGELERIKIPDLTYIPTKYLSLFPLRSEEPNRERPGRREQQAGGRTSGPEAEAEPRAQAAPATPWEDLSYEH